MGQRRGAKAVLAMRNGQPSQSQLKIEGRPISDSDNETYILHTWLSLAPFIFLSHVLRGQPHHNQLCNCSCLYQRLLLTNSYIYYIYIYIRQQAISFFLLSFTIRSSSVLTKFRQKVLSVIIFHCLQQAVVLYFRIQCKMLSCISEFNEEIIYSNFVMNSLFGSVM